MVQMDRFIRLDIREPMGHVCSSTRNVLPRGDIARNILKSSAIIIERVPIVNVQGGHETGDLDIFKNRERVSVCTSREGLKIKGRVPE